LLEPATQKNPDGEINIYDAIILSYVIEKAWGKSSCGEEGSLI
jgi:fructose-1,6-bisphosphatase